MWRRRPVALWFYSIGGTDGPQGYNEACGQFQKWSVLPKQSIPWSFRFSGKLSTARSWWPPLSRKNWINSNNCGLIFRTSKQKKWGWDLFLIYRHILWSRFLYSRGRFATFFKQYNPDLLILLFSCLLSTSLSSSLVSISSKSIFTIEITSTSKVSFTTILQLSKPYFYCRFS